MQSSAISVFVCFRLFVCFALVWFLFLGLDVSVLPSVLAATVIAGARAKVYLHLPRLNVASSACPNPPLGGESAKGDPEGGGGHLGCYRNIR